MLQGYVVGCVVVVYSKSLLTAFSATQKEERIMAHARPAVTLGHREFLVSEWRIASYRLAPNKTLFLPSVISAVHITASSVPTFFSSPRHRDTYPIYYHINLSEKLRRGRVMQSLTVVQNLLSERRDRKKPVLLDFNFWNVSNNLSEEVEFTIRLNYSLPTSGI